MKIAKIKKDIKAISKAVEDPTLLVYYMYTDYSEILLEDVREMSVRHLMGIIRNQTGFPGEFITIEATREAYTA